MRKCHLRTAAIVVVVVIIVVVIVIALIKPRRDAGYFNVDVKIRKSELTQDPTDSYSRRCWTTGVSALTCLSAMGDEDVVLTPSLHRVQLGNAFPPRRIATRISQHGEREIL